MENSRIEIAIKQLTCAGIDLEDARIEVESLFESAKSASEFESFIQRRITGEPCAYIVGHKEFYKSDFVVKKGVLIPRSDTEILVESALRFLGLNDFPVGDIYKIPSVTLKNTINMIDLCSGTGCVGISIVKEIQRNNLSAECNLVDIAPEALWCSTVNSKDIEGISVREIDVLDMSAIASLVADESLDLIVSNPPYINAKEMTELDKSVDLFEPHLALSGGEDGLMFYDVLAKEGIAFLKSGGTLIVEHGYNQGEEVREIFTSNGLRNVLTIRDYSGNDRVTFALK